MGGNLNYITSYIHHLPRKGKLSTRNLNTPYWLLTEDKTFKLWDKSYQFAINNGLPLTCIALLKLYHILLPHTNFGQGVKIS